MGALPAFVLFPLGTWRGQIAPEEWVALIDSWLALIDSHLSLPNEQFSSLSVKDESIPAFLSSFMREAAYGGIGILGSSLSAKKLLRSCFLLSAKLVQHNSPPNDLTQWEFLSDLARVYGKKRAGCLVSSLSGPSQEMLDSSLSGLKKFLVKNLDAGLQSDLEIVEEKLDRVNYLVHASSAVATFFLTGSDFLDALISCYKIANPPLRKAIVTTTYLCLTALATGENSKFSLLTDQLYSLKAAAQTHKAGPLNVNDSLVAELITVTPILQQLEKRIDSTDSSTSRAKSVLRDLCVFRKTGGMARPHHLLRRKVHKGKHVSMLDREGEARREMHVHRAGQISQVRDLFPELGSGFISRLLDEYEDDHEQVISHILDDSLPSYLQSADHGEELSYTPQPHPDLMPHSTPAPLPSRQNIFDDDELDRLAVSASQLYVGKRDKAQTADTMLADRGAAPSKAAILGALAAFDSDDDERDDTYDAEDVGGSVVPAGDGDDDPSGSTDTNDEALFRAWQADPGVFARDAATRRGSAARVRLRDDTGMTDEAIEGWAVMLQRNPARRRRLEARYGGAAGWDGMQAELASTAWRAETDDGESGYAVDSEVGTSGGESSSRGASSGSGRGRGRGRGRGGRGHGESVAGPAGDRDTEAARRRKEANKGSRANHNRRDQRARKMARGGFPG